MSFIDVLIIVVAVAAVVSAVVVGIINKKKGKTSCGCNCSDCSKCHGCSTINKKINTEK